MTPKEKALEIAMRFDKDGQTDNAKQCALICVDEIQSFPNNEFVAKGSLTDKFWNEVKTEINNL